MSATYDDLEQFHQRMRDIRLWGEARERIAALEGELAAANAAKEQFAEVFGCRHESLLDYAHDAAELKQAGQTYRAAKEAAESRLASERAWFAGWLERIGVRMDNDLSHEAEPDILVNERAEQAEATVHELEESIAAKVADAALTPNVQALVERYKAGEKALAEVGGLKALVGMLAATLLCIRGRTTLDACNAQWIAEKVDDALSALPESLAREWREGREAAEMLNWLDQHWAYGIDEPPLYVADVTPLREALRSAIAGKER